ncbi:MULTISPECIES: 50S ribosomal protein L29 [Thermodesulfobacterium]|jgi:large subunit ribosomal protein L29|uniref:Large ribosomal subunit protein uL29 n=2 Tax=Thermodesulfobacterium commune TaxID=1741 RepID=A0A075WT88_9BACT|nr:MULTISPECIES: 50S ribosomal protein L29 [Thermodesulfobacterium]KUJ98141.1 MAG: 50S ribosomal protein L29 [Thermodesulfobacterium sp. 37_54]KUK19787.1 MAG: 50S ribosomal protein L29 [Thermodesulfobacterium commune]AIH04230.1 50S ribosomal protein L29 [Thermodesulfobacterium commune DSM 2178]KUK37872.1 MAG: 50S ribosomal protein L29 [Thermodesulfobacterium commune]MBZ4682236.1 ribosomal protein [Thermodesulfobacterium sp.]
MKARDLRELSIPELKEKLASLREELFNLRFQKTVYKLENPMRIRQVKRDIARVLTVIREKELNIR